MKLKSVSIHGFRSIEHLDDLPLGAPTILSGHNDAGKSSIIDAIRALLGSYKIMPEDATFVQVSAPPTAGEIPRVDDTSIEGALDLNSSEAREFGASKIRIRRICRSGASAVLEMLELAPIDATLRDYRELTIPLLKDRLLTLALSTVGAKGDLLSRLDVAAAAAPKANVWVKAPNGLEKALPRVERFDAAGAIDAEAAIRSTLQTAYRTHLEGDDLKGGLRAIEKSLEAKLVDDVEIIRQHIIDKVGDIGNVLISPTVNFASASGLKATEITVTNYAGEGVNLQRSGAGRARRIALAVWEYNSVLLKQSSEDIVLLYDEPDTHLDYGHQRDLMRLIHEQTTYPNVTVVVASHSMNMIDGTDISNVVHIRHDHHRTTVDLLADDSEVGSHLGAIAASVGLRNTVLLHERLFVGVEGDSEARALPVLFKLAMGSHLESSGIAIWPCDNNEGALRFAQFLIAHGRNVAFLVDSDSRRTAKHIFQDSRLRGFGLDPALHCLYLGDPDEIEDLFDDEQWARAANKLWPRNGSDQPSSTWEERDFSSLRSGKFSSGVCEMLRSGSLAGPGGKPEMLHQLALSLSNPSDVPPQLVERFKDLIVRAD